VTMRERGLAFNAVAGAARGDSGRKLADAHCTGQGQTEYERVPDRQETWIPSQDQARIAPVRCGAFTQRPWLTRPIRRGAIPPQEQLFQPRWPNDDTAHVSVDSCAGASLGAAMSTLQRTRVAPVSRLCTPRHTRA
jgi:hypothetical protein